MFGQNNQSQGFGGVPNQGNTGGLFGGGGGLFQNNQVASSFAQPQNSFAAPAASQFGGATTFGGASPFGGAQQNTGIFGDNQNANQQQNQGGLFGQTNSVFGQPQQNTQAQGFGNLGGQGTNLSGIGGQATSSQGLFGAQTQGGLFGAQTQSSGLFGQNNQQASSQFQAVNKPAFGGIGLSGFGGQNQAASFFGGQQSGFNQNLAQPQIYGTNSLGQQPQKEKISFFQQQNSNIQLVHSLNSQFEFKNIPQDDNKGQKSTARFRNIRVEPQFQNLSQQMLRFIDMTTRQRGEIIECPEWKAQQEWQQKQSKYSLGRMISQGQQNLQSFGNQIGGGLGLNQAPGFQALQQPLGQQPQNQNSIFGQNTGQSLFQNNQSGFNQQVPSQGGLFQSQQSQQPQQPAGLFAQPQGAFGQPPQQSSSLFNQPTQNQQNQSTGIFCQSNSLFSGTLSGQQTPAFQNQNQQSSLGLLGQQNKQSIFGQSAPQPSAGLFNQPQQSQLGNTFNQQPQPSATLFPSSGGIFQNNNNPSQLQKQGSLFEQKPVQSTLFQNTQQNTQQTQGGLFNKTSLFNQPAQPSSLFPAQQNQASSLFDNKAAPAPTLSQLGSQQPPQGQLFQTPQTNALFSNTQPNQLQQKSTLSAPSLFNQQQPAQSSLWGQPSTSSLFNTQQPPQQQLFQSQQPSNTFQNQINNQQQTQQPIQMNQQSQFAQDFYKQGLDDPLGIQGGILEQPMILKSIEEEIQLIQKESNYLKNQNKLSLTTSINKGSYTTSLSIGGDILAQHQLSYPSHLNEEQRFKDKQMMKESAFDTSDSYIREKYTVPSNVNLQKFKSYQSQREAPYVQQNSVLKQQTIYAPPQLKKDKSIAVKSEKQQPSSPKQNKDVIQLKINCEDLQENQLEYNITVHTSRDIIEVLKNVEDWLKKELGSKNLLEEKQQDIKIQNLQLIKDNYALPESCSLKQAGITSNQDLQLIYSVVNSKKRNQPTFHQNDEYGEERTNSKNFLRNKMQNSNNNLYDESFRPVPPKQGYETIPSMSVLYTYSKQELSSLKSFTIKNIFGSIEFKRLNGQEGIDLTYVNLYKDININERDVNVYENCDPENGLFSKNQKPQVGQKLNLPAIITLNKVAPTKNRTAKQYEMVLKNMLQDQEKSNKNENDLQAPEHLSYNHLTYEWQFKVPHFTKWGADEDDEMEPVSPNQNSNQLSNLKNIEQGFDQTQIVQKEEEKEILENDIQNDKINFSTQIKRSAYGSIQHTKQVEYQNSQTLQLQKKRNTSLIQNQGEKYQTPAQIFQQKLNDKIQSRRQAVLLQQQAQNNFEKSILISQDFVKSMKVKQNVLVKGQRPCWRPIINKNGIPEEQILTIGKQNNYQQVILNKIQTQIQTNYEKLIPALLDRMDIIESANENDVPGIDFPISQTSQQNQSIQTHISQILLEMAVEYRTIFQNLQQKLEKESEKLNNEFYLISLMNIIFGDPRIHLIKLHPLNEQFKDLGGYNSFLKSAQQFHSKPFDDLQDLCESEKIKRNSLIILLKFICQQEDKVQILENKVLNEKQIYQKAYQLMVNGDIVKATKFLSGKKKHNISLILSQSLSATQNKKMQIRQHSLQISSDENQSEFFQKIINLITFQPSSNLDEFFKMHDKLSWKQCLCSLLMYVYDPRQSFSQILKQFISYKEAEDLSKIDVKVPNQNQKPQDLIYTLLKVYLNMKQENLYQELLQNYDVYYEINQFLNQVVKPFSIKSQDNQIFWLVHLVLKTYGLKFRDINALQIQSEFQDQISVKYSNYLLNIGAFEKCFVIAMFIQNQQLKNQVVYEQLNQVQNSLQNGLEFSSEKKLMLQNFIFQKLKIPVKYILKIQGNKCLSEKSFIQSMTKYVEINDFETAHSIFMQSIAPQYFGTPQLIQQLCKSIYKFDTRINPSGDFTFKSQVQRQVLDFILSLFKEGEQQVNSFSQNGAGMMLQVLNLLDKYVIWNEQKTAASSQKVQEVANDLKKKLEYIMQDKQEFNFMFRSIYQVVDRISQDCNQKNSNQFLANGFNVVMCQEPDHYSQNHEMIQI